MLDLKQTKETTMAKAAPQKEAITFEYMKEETGEVTARRLVPIGAVPAQNLRALDLTQFTSAEETTVIGAYSDWETTVKKPFDKKVREFSKELGLQSFEKFLEEKHGIVVETAVKSFKESGLTRVG